VERFYRVLRHWQAQYCRPAFALGQRGRIYTLIRTARRLIKSRRRRRASVHDSLSIEYSTEYHVIQLMTIWQNASNAYPSTWLAQKQPVRSFSVFAFFSLLCSGVSAAMVQQIKQLCATTHSRPMLRISSPLPYPTSGKFAGGSESTTDPRLVVLASEFRSRMAKGGPCKRFQ